MPTIESTNRTITILNTHLPEALLNHIHQQHAHWYGLHTKADGENLIFIIQKKRYSLSIESEQRINIHQLATIGITINKKHAPRQKQQKRPLIAIDCGHGGHDLGTHQYGINEKDVVLAIGKQLDHILHERGYRTYLTRADDRFVPLDERTTRANLKHASVFISLHNNANNNHQRRGVTVFYENNLSKKLAERIYDALISTQESPKILGNGIHQELAQVIYGTSMPAIIVELLFMSNKQDAQLLNTPDYQKLLAHRIANGIIQFLRL